MLSYWRSVVAAGIILTAWQICMELELLPALLVASPIEVGEYIFANLDLLVSSTLVTLREVALGFGIALLLGVTLAVIMTEVRFVNDAVMPLLIITQVVPSIAIAPLLVLVLGIGDAPKIAMAAIISFFPVIVNTAAGLQSLDADMTDLGRSLNSSRIQLLWYLRIPNALPYVFTGIRIGITLSVIGAVVGEFVSADSGLGYLVLQGNATLNPSLIFASIVCLSVVGIALFALASLLQYIAVPWARGRKNA